MIQSTHPSLFHLTGHGGNPIGFDINLAQGTASLTVTSLTHDENRLMRSNTTTKIVHVPSELDKMRNCADFFAQALYCGTVSEEDRRQTLRSFVSSVKQFARLKDVNITVPSFESLQSAPGFWSGADEDRAMARELGGDETYDDSHLLLGGVVCLLDDLLAGQSLWAEERLEIEEKAMDALTDLLLGESTERPAEVAASTKKRARSPGLGRVIKACRRAGNEGADIDMSG